MLWVVRWVARLNATFCADVCVKSLKLSQLCGWYLIGAYSGAKKLKFEDLGLNVDSLLAKCAQKVEKTAKNAQIDQKLFEIS